MQPPVVMAFRKRLKSYGYRDIKILKIQDCDNEEKYLVTAIEPLASVVVEAEYSIITMYYAFK